NARMPNKRRLDLARLDVKAPQLHLRVRPPHKLQHPVRTPARQIPAAVHPPARSPIRVRNKPLRRQTSPPQIATPKPSSRDVKLPANPNRHRLQTNIQNIDAKVWNAAPNKTAGIRDSSLVERDVGDMHRRFGDAVHINKVGSAVRVMPIPLLEPAQLKRFTTKDHVTKCEIASKIGGLPLCLHQLIKRGWRLIEDGDAFPADQAQKLDR